MLVERARYRNNIDVSVGWVLQVFEGPERMKLTTPAPPPPPGSQFVLHPTSVTCAGTRGWCEFWGVEISHRHKLFRCARAFGTFLLSRQP